MTTFDDATMSGEEFAQRTGGTGGNGAAGEAPRDRNAELRLVPPSEMDFSLAQLNLVRGIVGHRMLALLYGESGSAKSLIALDLALHIALGRDWCGRKVKPGFVAYIAPEGGHSIHLRFHAWCRHHGVDPRDDRLPFRTIPARLDLCHNPDDAAVVVANVKAAEAELGPCVLVVVDTVSRALAGGNENGPEDMGAFVANCDRLREGTGATTFAVHHTPQDGTEPRGHKSLKNAADIRLRAAGVIPGSFVVEIAHLKDGRGEGELVFQITTATVGTDMDGEPITGALVVPSEVRPAGQAGRGKGLTARQLRALQELQAEAHKTKRWDFSFEEFHDMCIRAGTIEGKKPENQQRARASDLRTQLANRGAIKVDRDTIRLVGTEA